MTGQSTKKKNVRRKYLLEYLFLLVSNRYSVAAVCDTLLVVTVARAMLRVH